MREFLEWNYTKIHKRVKYEYLRSDYLGNHAVYAFNENDILIAYLHWLGGKIINVNVVDKWRRQGIATRLYELASQKSGNRLEHSADLTVEGAGWVRSLQDN
ncbi:hypothetical protein J433_05020 [Corynebacterium glutamicum MT]|uniref:N-acetyltransferase domain-containing protein n=1 Tax=Corynebacterium glutamicum TaxID=1718 RepID=A0AB36ICU7_CORGT|nr:hypothetical protein C624_08220 [Corynebacterium glutamicum SCgG1]AGN22244.1 hypothetical protein C629_08230 [Corynebacterium glutamicum SCgG2]EGV40734.1 hypothetical protein CgS9114_07040 [Corynebacterium glutamicum S9114]EOA65207.1 hypothetical protein J433_05020 [Corynebacterium glutamicum MT]EPP40703.1 hypothetical protein A583_07745 [Corynebacterium glutamicum Z188]NII87288.1 ribosomal protein S18 acetylase RimI-like enzyme [Corynebacterium glutamicum]